jgi:hypothetical protein
LLLSVTAAGLGAEDWGQPQLPHTVVAAARVIPATATTSTTATVEAEKDRSRPHPHAPQCESAAADPAQPTLRGCTIERRRWGSLGVAEFENRFVKEGKPLLLTDAHAAFVSQPESWATKGGFLRAFGDVQVHVGTSVELAQFGGRGRTQRRLPLSAVVAQFGKQADEDFLLAAAAVRRDIHEPRP